jgi:UDP-N-acetylglucosamine--N-acetylmuramyl-(pentapeptide) pyrophosphoryl-undecaprenol N-acetylglucosamine transferase
MTDARTGARLSGVLDEGEHYILRGAGLAGRGMARALRASLALTSGTMQARQILLRLDASVVVGFGGYPCVPPVLAARSLRRRPGIILHEQNAVLGRANRFCARFADVLALGFDNTKGVPAGATCLSTGNPVRPAIQALAGSAYLPPTDRIELLVMGGSLGARVFSDVVPDAIGLLPEAIRTRLHVVQQCRVEDLARARAAYRVAGVDADLAPFFTDIAERLAAAHLVISRAGASSCAEIAVAGRPAILVPLPSAIDDHQRANADALDGAQVVAQSDLTAAGLSALLAGLWQNPESLAEAARRIAAIGRPDAADTLADAVERIIAPVELPR